MRAVMDEIRVASLVVFVSLLRFLRCCAVVEQIFCMMSGVRSIAPAWLPCVSEWLVGCSFFMPRLCDAAILDSYAHVVDEVLRCLIVCMDEIERDHYLFLQAASAKCQTCLSYWLHHGADLRRATASHLDWIALVLQRGLPRGRVPSVRGWSWTCTRTFPAGFIGEKSAR